MNTPRDIRLIVILAQHEAAGLVSQGTLPRGPPGLPTSPAAVWASRRRPGARPCSRRSRRSRWSRRFDEGLRELVFGKAGGVQHGPGADPAEIEDSLMASVLEEAGVVVGSHGSALPVTLRPRGSEASGPRAISVPRI